MIPQDRWTYLSVLGHLAAPGIHWSPLRALRRKQTRQGRAVGR